MGAVLKMKVGGLMAVGGGLALLLTVALTVAWGSPAVHGASGAAPATAFAPAEVVRKDTCRAIQRAIDALPPEGGQVIVQAGRYTCTEPIVIDRDHVDLKGEGPATVLQLAAGANAPVLVIGQTSTPPTTARRHIQISDLRIDGNRAHQTLECWGGPCDTGGTMFIRNSGIVLRRVEDVLVERVTAQSARSGGLVSERGSRRVTVRDFTAFDNHFDGLAAYETEDSTFVGLHLHDNLAAGLSFDLRFNNNLISDAVITGSGTVGIFMRDARDNLFEGMLVRRSREYGLFLAQVDADATKPAAGNTFSGLVVSDSGRAGLRVNDASDVDNLVVGAQFVHNAGVCPEAGISEAAPGLVQRFGIICR